jgi:hypothetical protein
MRRSDPRKAIPAFAGLLLLAACRSVPVEPQDHEARADPYYAELDRIAAEGGQLAILERIEQKRKSSDAEFTDFRVELPSGGSWIPIPSTLCTIPISRSGLPRAWLAPETSRPTFSTSPRSSC